MKKKFVKQLGAALMSVTIATSSCIGASACCGMYIGNEKSENGSTFVGRSEDIGKLYDKVFDVHPAADHAEGEMYKDSYGFSMPFPAHTYRYTIMRDSYNQGETMKDENGNYIGEAYGEVGINEHGVAVSATVSTYLNSKVLEEGGWEEQKNPDTGETEWVWVTEGYLGSDPLVDDGTGICEISLNSVILQSAKTAKEGVEILAAIIDQYGSGEGNSLTISDGNEVWDFEIVSGHQYAAVKMPADKVSVNPNLLLMREIDVSDTENVIASENLIQLAQDNGFLVSSQLDENGQPTVDTITKIDVAKTYGSDIGYSDSRYWQGVNYLNPEMTAKDPDLKIGDMLLDTDETFSTYEALRLLGYRGEGTAYEGKYSIGNDNQAECHVFEIREGMPEDLAIIQWQTLSRAEFSVYLPFYSALLTETSDIFKTEYITPKDADGKKFKEIGQFIDDIPEDSIYWAFAALNDLCDNDRELYGKNVKLFWEGYQKALIEQQEAVDEAMLKIYAYSPALAEEKATALGKLVAEQAFECAKSMKDELWAHIQTTPNEVFVPSVLTEGVAPEYSIDMVGGTGIPTFPDVPVDAWFAEAVDYVTNKGIMTGMGDDAFAPNAKLSRAMIAQVLYSLEGKPAAEGAPFTDVAADAWFADAVNWAAVQEIVTGYGDGKFGPNDNITREQMALILFGYAKSKGYDVTAKGDLTVFTDGETTSSWAAEAVQWAVGSKLLSGKGGTTLDPMGTATRAEVAQILMAFCENIAK